MYMNTEVYTKLLCCYFDQITKIFNDFVILTFIIETLLQIQTIYRKKSQNGLNSDLDYRLLSLKCFSTSVKFLKTIKTRNKIRTITMMK